MGLVDVDPFPSPKFQLKLLAPTDKLVKETGLQGVLTNATEAVGSGVQGLPPLHTICEMIIGLERDEHPLASVTVTVKVPVVLTVIHCVVAALFHK